LCPAVSDDVRVRVNDRIPASTLAPLTREGVFAMRFFMTLPGAVRLAVMFFTAGMLTGFVLVR